MMKKFVLKSTVLSMACAITMSSCCVKMTPLKSTMVKSEPKPLELVGSNVPSVITVQFPAKWFPKNATLKIIPTLRYQGGEKEGAAYTFQGEDFKGNDPVISYQEGDNVTLHFSVPYNHLMKKSELYLKFDATNDGEKVTLPEIKVNNGVVTTSEFASAYKTQPLFAPDGFERIVKDSHDAELMFDIQKANVKKSELQDEAVAEWTDIVENAKYAPNQEVAVEIQAYASPDGGVKLNRNLSEQREKNTKAAISKELKRNKINGIEIDSHYTAQDWEGFRQLVQKSDIPDKDLIIRILEMYPNSEQREAQIKNLSAVFSRLADDILPKLRRARLIANVTTIGKSDEEILQWLEQHPGSLNLEELLHAATLQTNDSQKEATYKLIKQAYPKDYRAFNNLGVLAWNRGDKDMADFWFDMADKRQKNPYSTVNKGLVALSSGDMVKAQELLSAGSSLQEAAPIMGLLQLKKGEYAEAQKSYGTTKTNNAAVAQLLNMDYAAAINTLKSVSSPNAETYYLLAVASARTKDPQALFSNLEKAIKANPALKNRAKDDLEFMDYMKEPSFLMLVK